MTITLAWWHPGILLLAIGLALFLGGKSEGTYIATPDARMLIGALLMLLGVVWLIIGLIARAMP